MHQGNEIRPVYGLIYIFLLWLYIFVHWANSLVGLILKYKFVIQGVICWKMCFARALKKERPM